MAARNYRTEETFVMNMYRILLILFWVAIENIDYSLHWQVFALRGNTDVVDRY